PRSSSPATPPPSATHATLTRNRRIATNAAAATTVLGTSMDDQTGRGMVAKNGRAVSTSSNRTFAATVNARLAITPRTAAVTAVSAARRARLARSRSTHGAPRKTQRKHGANVAHTVTAAPTIPAATGASAPGLR